MIAALASFVVKLFGMFSEDSLENRIHENSEIKIFEDE